MSESLLLTREGGDRATGYTMNNKIVSLPEGYLCTWLDSGRQNRWALVNRDPLAIGRSGTIGRPGIDNHWGAALVRAQGTIHALIGGHHGPLEHHTFDQKAGEWAQVGIAGQRATYPCAISDSRGAIHAFYRCSSEDRWYLNYVCHEGGTWSEPIHLVEADKPGYVYWTNGAVVGPDDVIHLVIGNTRLLERGDLLYSASHIQSADGGRSWTSSVGGGLGGVPIQAGDIPLLDAPGSSNRIQTHDEIKRYEAPGPENYNYNQMNLSNPVIDSKGDLHVVFHNNRDGSADLWSLTQREWSVCPLTTTVTGDTGHRVHPQSSLVAGADGRIEAALMVEPTDRCVWGPAGTYLGRVTVQDGCVGKVKIGEKNPEVARWLPAFSHHQSGSAFEDSVLLYTCGQNAGGFGNNSNELKTDVYVEAG